jgi:hypothetical protein
MKGTRFEAILSIQQTVTGELKAIQEEAFPRVFHPLYDRCECSAEAGGTIMSDGINIFFVCFLWPQFGNLIVTLCIHSLTYFSQTK